MLSMSKHQIFSLEGDERQGMSFDEMRRDPLYGGVVYQIFVDRFYASTPLAKREQLLRSGQTPKAWTQKPKSSKPDEMGRYPHLFEFWGGDLNGIREKLDYLESLNVDIVYLTPIFKSPSNHRYDTEDYFQIDPLVGTWEDFVRLKNAVHERGMKLVLDGVFNHAGDTHSRYLDAKAGGEFKDWFVFGEQFRGGVRGFYGIPSMPAWNLENEEVRQYLWGSEDSVVQHYIKEGIDGWRLDVAYDIGPVHLRSLTETVHAIDPKAIVVGEVMSYPGTGIWSKSLDGIFNFFWLRVLELVLGGEIGGSTAGQFLKEWIQSSASSYALRSWIHLDNHDTIRIAEKHELSQRRLLFGLQMTLPGSPVIYYGSELGLKGGHDPECRAPMPWDQTKTDNADLKWVRQLTSWRRDHIGLRIGNCTMLTTQKLIAFTRTTDRTFEGAVVVANPTQDEVTEVLSTQIPSLMSGAGLIDLESGERLILHSGLVTVSMSPLGFRILVPERIDMHGYGPYDRIP
jgi:cyclomaltodextrinase / maltogenic alpha-amylase / neopullulanase